MHTDDEFERYRNSIRATCASRTAKRLLQIIHQPLTGPAKRGALTYAWSRFKGCLRQESPQEQDVAVAVAWEDLVDTGDLAWRERAPIVTVQALASASAHYLDSNQDLLHHYPVPMRMQWVLVKAEAKRQITLRTTDYYQLGSYAIPRWQADGLSTTFVRVADMPALLADEVSRYLGDLPPSVPGMLTVEAFEEFLLKTPPGQVELDLLAGYQVSSPSTSRAFPSM